MTRRAFRPATAVLVLGLVAAACSGGGGGSSPGSGSGGAIQLPGGISATNKGTTTVSGSSTQIEASNAGGSYFFTPTVLKASGGKKLTVTVKNSGDTEHNFSIDAAGINKNLQPGQSVTVQVTLPSSGTLVFYCAFHKALGMAGQFTTS